jgi:hypothetical protein
LKDISIVHSDGYTLNYNNEQVYLCNNNDRLEWDRDFPTAANSATVDITFKYKSFGLWFNAGIGLTYGHTGAISPVTISYTPVEISPNNYQFIYTGTNNISSYDYDFDFGDGVVISGSGLDNLSNNVIGANSGQSPHFYCRSTGMNMLESTNLTVHRSYVIYGQQTNEHPSSLLNTIVSTTEECDLTKDEGLILEDLCLYLSTPSVESVPDDEFDMEYTTTNVSDPLLAPFVTGINVTFGDGTSSSPSLGQVVPHTYPQTGNPNQDYQNYPIDYIVTFQGGCSCSDFINYDTGDPCYNMGPITISSRFDDQTGEYVYTLVPSVYAGGNPNVPNIQFIVIDWGDGTPPESFFPPFNITHVFPDDGYYVITQSTYFGENEFPCITYLGGDNDPSNPNGVYVSTYCCENFAPEDGKKYWISAWVKEDLPAQVKTYENTSIEVEFLGANPSTFQFYPTGDIVEGWQRIVGTFIVPAQSTQLKVHLVNGNGQIDAYFDDVRVHPFNASMKSYVYDPETFWLTAELDDNNYATFYEYDKEGQLIRIKKETARGIMTIQESRSSNPKRDE